MRGTAAHPHRPAGQQAAGAGKQAPAPSSRGTRVLHALRWVVLLAALLVPAYGVWSALPPFVIGDAVCVVERYTTDRTAGLRARYETALAADDAVFSPRYNQTMHWGTYRPQVYLGVRNRAPRGLLFGIAWYDLETGAGGHGVRHTAEDDQEMLFRWETHDGRFFGSQLVEDRRNGLQLRIHFLKTPDGKAWAVRVSATRKLHRRLAFVLYFVDEAQHTPLNYSGRAFVTPSTPVPSETAPDLEAAAAARAAFVEQHGIVDEPNAVFVSGTAAAAEGASVSPDEFVAAVRDRCNSATEAQPWEAFGYQRSVDGPDGRLPFDVDITASRRSPDRRRLPLRASASTTTTGASTEKRAPYAPNVITMRKVFTDDFRVEVVFSTRPSEGRAASGSSKRDHELLESCQIHNSVSLLEQAFHAKFDRLFSLDSSLARDPRVLAAGDANGRPAPSVATLVHMAKSGLSNMLGGMGYWHGSFKTTDTEDDRRLVRRMRKEPETAHPVTVEEPPRSLFSGVPSRAKFPRGFLWDEGFHQLLVARWAPEISKDVISHWLKGAMMTESGWIPREQILGPEARTRVPAQFVPQHPTHANPPSMMLQIQNFAFSAAAGSSRDLAFVRDVWPFVERWRDWYARTQCAGFANCSYAPPPHLSPADAAATSATGAFQGYRWRSRNGFHLLACGLDDYPRPVCAERATREKHLDLFSWITMMNETIHSIAVATAKIGGDGARHETSNAPTLSFNDDALVSIHWNEDLQLFSDVTGCVTEANKPAPKTEQQRANTDDNTKPFKADALYYSPLVGYVNLFPVLTMILDDAGKARATIRAARSMLMTGFGLTSVAAESRAMLPRMQRFVKGHENYWVGPVWINLNFMMLRALRLKYNAMVGAEAVALYEDLRADLIRSIGREYQRTGKLWENYNQETGHGQGTAPFTGWTTLIILIMAEQY